MNTIGERIKQTRIRKGITQKELAEKLGTTPQNLAQYESGKRNPKLETIKKIAQALNVPLMELSPILDSAKNGDVHYVDEWLGIKQDSNHFLRFSALLKPLMESKGINSEQLAKAVGLPIAVIQGYEQERCFPKFETIEKIAKALKVPSSSLTPIINVKEDMILLPSDVFPAERTTSLVEYMSMNNKPTTAYFDAWLLASECDYMAIIRNGVKGYYFCLTEPENIFDESLFFVTENQFESVRSYSTGYARHLIRQFNEKNTKVSESILANTN